MSKRSSIQGQVVMMIMSITTVLIVSVTVLMTWLFISTLRNMHRETALSEIGFAAEYCVVPLLFDSPDDAKQILENYISKPAVKCATLYNSSGTYFAHYGDSTIVESVEAVASLPVAEYSDNYLHLKVPIMSDGENIGILEVVEETNELYSNITIILIMVGLVIPVTLLFAYVFAQIVQKRISSPILNLATVIGTVQYGNTIRDLESRPSDSKEIATLHSKFKEMVARIESGEKKLVETKDYLQIIVNSIHSLLIVINEKHEITMGNMLAEQAALQDRIIGTSLWESFPFLSNISQTIQGALVSQEPKEVRAAKVDTQGLGSCHIAVFPLFSQERSGVVISITDVTESIKRDLQLTQIQKMETVGTLAGGLAHDFNNIINGIVGTLSIMELDEEPPEMTEYQENIALMNHAADRAKEMVDQLLTLSHKSELSFETIDMRDVVDNVVSFCEHSIDKSVEILTTVHCENSKIRGNSSQLEQVLLNLCVNAAHAMTIMRKGRENGGILDISLKDRCLKEEGLSAISEIPPGEYLELSIRDTGVGIPPENIKKIFDPFFTTKGKGEGTGLGLSMVYNIVSQHKGYLTIESTVNVGTLISLFFAPVDKEHKLNEGRGKASGEVSHSGKTVLIIDDDVQIRFVAKKMFRKLGFDVLYAENGKQGLEIFKKEVSRIDLVLLDMVMPGLSGKEVYLKLLNINPEVDVILSSGFGQDERVLDVLALGLSGFLHKPYTFNEFKEVVFKVLPPK